MGGSMKTQLETILMVQAWRSNRSRIPFLIGFVILSACAETSVTEPSKGDGGPWSSHRAETGTDDDALPDLGDSSSQGNQADGDNEDAGCSIVDGGCSEGCVPCMGYRYDTELGCRYPWHIMVCFNTYGIYPPASPVAQLDPEGNCWILTNPPPEMYGGDDSAWTNGGTACVAGLPHPDLPYCEP